MRPGAAAAPLRVLVTGGRHYRDAEALCAALEELHSKHGIAVLIQGGARGADGLALAWARGAGIPVKTYRANWKAHGRGAGPRRNRAMLQLEQPDLVLAFPGGRGTADMLAKARRAGVTVLAAGQRQDQPRREPLHGGSSCED